MKQNKNKYAKRVLVFFLVVFLALSSNIVYLCVTGKTLISGENIRDYSKQRGAGRVTKIDYATRGTIYTSDGKIAARDVKRYNLYAVLSHTRKTAKDKPAYVVNKLKTARELSKILGADESYILKKLQGTGYQTEFGNKGKNLTSIIKDKIESLALPGIEFTEVRSRNYTFGDFASYEIGYASSSEEDKNDLYGKMGIEQSFNSYLKGTNGKTIYLADNNGNTLPNGVLSKTNAVSGKDVYLTINSQIQTQLDSLMSEFIENEEPEVATCAVMDAKTGKILAVTDYPSFDPNKRDLKSYTGEFLNGAYEPGSPFKVFVYANALTDNVLDVNDYYKSGYFNYRSAGRIIATIHDVNRRGWGTISYAEGLYRSSNTAICNILQNKAKMSSLISDYKTLGFFQSSKVDGLVSGSGVKGFDGKTKSLEYYTTGFGQGSSVTPFQLLRGYTAFANDGKIVQPYLVDKVVDPKSKKVIYQGKSVYSEKIYSTSAVNTMKYLMYGVTHDKAGTVHSVYEDSEADIIGKSGTGQYAVNGRYSANEHYHTFAGLAPYNDPRIAFVIAWRAKSPKVSGAATVLKAIAKSALNTLSSNAKKVKTSSYTITQYKNQSISYASKMLTKNGLSPLVIGDGTSVVSQYPEANTTLTSGSRVMLLSDGKNLTMPSLIGWSRKEAEAFASLTGINLKIEGSGLIYKQEVEKGAKIKENQNIKVYAK